MILNGRISRVVLNTGVNIQLFSHVYGQAYLTDVYDEFRKDPLDEYSSKVGDIVQCYVLDVDKKKNKVDVSLRDSRLFNKNFNEKFPEITSISQLTPGTLVHGYVRKTDNKTCFVGLNRHITGIVYVSDLSDKYVKNPSKRFPPGKLVTGRITKVDPEKNEVRMTLKKSLVTETKLTISDIDPGMVVKGWVKAIREFGVFITIKNSSLVGLCHVSEIDDSFTKEPKDVFKVGDYVKAYILRVNKDKKKLSLSLKPSYFQDVVLSTESEESIVDDSSENSAEDQQNDTDKMDTTQDAKEENDVEMEDKKPKVSLKRKGDPLEPPKVKKQKKEVESSSSSSEDKIDKPTLAIQWSTFQSAPDDSEDSMEEMFKVQDIDSEEDDNKKKAKMIDVLQKTTKIPKLEIEKIQC